MRRVALTLVWILSLTCLTAAGALGQTLGTTADRDTGVEGSLGLFVERWNFLSLTGASLRASFPVGKRLSPFGELCLVRFEAVRGEAAEQTEGSVLLGGGTKFFLAGEERFGQPVSFSAYTRVEFGLLRNIDLFSLQGMLLGTYDLTDEVPLLLHLGVGVSYRYTRMELPDQPEETDNQTHGRYLLTLEAPLSDRVSVLMEVGYEQRAAASLAARYRL